MPPVLSYSSRINRENIFTAVRINMSNIQIKRKLFTVSRTNFSFFLLFVLFKNMYVLTPSLFLPPSPTFLYSSSSSSFLSLPICSFLPPKPPPLSLNPLLFSISLLLSLLHFCLPVVPSSLTSQLLFSPYHMVWRWCPLVVAYICSSWQADSPH